MLEGILSDVTLMPRDKTLSCEQKRNEWMSIVVTIVV